VRGVINLRGKVIPLVDLRVRFRLPAAADDDRTCVVVAQVPSSDGGLRPYGVVVDGVEEVAAFTDADLEPVPDFGGAVDARFLTGMAKTSTGVVTLIDLDAIAATEHEPEANESAKGADA
jgi:purine-binding chemotaxis protein CheW